LAPIDVVFVTTSAAAGSSGACRLPGSQTRHADDAVVQRDRWPTTTLADRNLRVSRVAVRAPASLPRSRKMIVRADRRARPADGPIDVGMVALLESWRSMPAAGRAPSANATRHVRSRIGVVGVGTAQGPADRRT
jgi:hypothetical protein